MLTMCNAHKDHFIEIKGDKSYPVGTVLIAKQVGEEVILTTEIGKEAYRTSNAGVECAFAGPYNGAVVREHIGKNSVIEILAWEEISRVIVSSLTGLPIGTFLKVIGNDSKVHFLSEEGEMLATLPMGPLTKEFKYRTELMGRVVGFLDEKPIVQILHWADLHRHSGFSLLDGANKISDLVAKTDFAGAITDHGAMYGVLDFYKSMKKAGKLPILGFEAYAETIGRQKKGNHLLLLAKDLNGFHNLMKLTSEAYENFHGKPHVSYEMLSNYRGGIISTTSCMGSEISQLLLERKYDDAKYVAKTMMDIVGKDDYYVEIQRHGFEEELIVNPQLMRIARELDLKIIGTTDSHYTEEEDKLAHEALLCIGTKKLMSDEDRLQFPGTGYHLHSTEEVEKLFADIPEALDNTLEIAKKCANLELELGVNHLPEFDVPEDDMSEMEYLRKITWEGFNKRFEGKKQQTDPVYLERLEYEMEVLEKMGFPGYFLIVEDFVRFAKENGIPVGPGRGSGAGSLVLYSLAITDVDPIPYGLLFERFLNPDRISMPDIDMDFADDRRDEVIEYVKKKYGTNSVSQIITFGTLSAKAVSKDVARVLGFPSSLGQKISDTIPKRPKITIKEAIKESPEFADLISSNADVKLIVTLAEKLEGLPRHASIHACGVAIVTGNISDYLPYLMMEDKKKKGKGKGKGGKKEVVKVRTTQFTMSEVEEMGVLKMDFLGLRTMSVIGNALEEINENLESENLETIHPLAIPLDDKQFYLEIAKGNANGVFQLESGGMQSFMKDLFSDVEHMAKGSMELFERLVAGVSLYRPGPMDYIPDYLKNMRNPRNIKYDHPDLEPILKDTYGVIVYQEQTMHIVQVLANFTKGEADNVRKAFAKKKQDMILPLRNKFLDGCVNNNISKEVAVAIWTKMEKFGSYAFNRSHAVAYSRISVMSAFIKAYYPVEYMTSTLNSYINKPDKLKLFLSYVKKMGIPILPPDLNKSQRLFKSEGKAIRFGLMGLKGLGASTVGILRERNSIRGQFASVQDYVERMVKHEVFSPKSIETLAYAGALDCFGDSRRAVVSFLPELTKHADNMKKDAKKTDPNQMSLLDFLDEEDAAELQLSVMLRIPPMEEMDKKIRLQLEKEYAGFYLSEHPLDDYASFFESEGIYEIGFLLEEGDEDSEHRASTIADDDVEDHEITTEISLGGIEDYNGENVKLAGIVTEHEVFYTKRDQKPIHVFQLEDHTASIKCVVFDSDLDHNRDHLVEGKIVMLEGKVKVDDFGGQVIVRQMVDVEAIARLENPKLVWVKSDNQILIKQLFAYIEKHPGAVPVNVVYNGKAYRAKGGLSLNYSSYSKLQDMFGQLVKIDY